MVMRCDDLEGYIFSVKVNCSSFENSLSKRYMCGATAAFLYTLLICFYVSYIEDAVQSFIAWAIIEFAP